MREKKKIFLIFGTRPDAVKMCPLVKELRSRELFDCRVCVTGQHRQMLDGTLNAFEVVPDYDLDIMKPQQDLFDITIKVLKELRTVLVRETPHIVLVHGDTTTAFSSALACFYLGIPIGHIEAGLRTDRLKEPFPEEWNRRAVGEMADFHFAPTERAKRNLLREGKREERIFVVGNTGIDALRTTVRSEYCHPELEWARGSRLILLTAHRRENIGLPMRNMFRSVRRILNEFENVKIIYPVHLNPAVRALAEEELGGRDRIHLIDPLDVVDFHNFLSRCYFVLTDSGGIQEEAPALDKPVLVMRNITERQEGLEAGIMRLIGTGEGTVYRGIRDLLETPALYDSMSRAKNPYGDGFASRRIADHLERLL